MSLSSPPKPLSSTTPIVQHIPQFNTKNPSVQHTDGFLVLNRGVRWTEECIELRGVSKWGGLWNWGVCWTKGFWCWIEEFWCWTEGVLVLNWGLSGVELRGFWCWTEGFRCWTEGFPCWTEACLELRGPSWEIFVPGISENILGHKNIKYLWIHPLH